MGCQPITYRMRYAGKYRRGISNVSFVWVVFNHYSFRRLNIQILSITCDT